MVFDSMIESLLPPELECLDTTLWHELDVRMARLGWWHSKRVEVDWMENAFLALAWQTSKEDRANSVVEDLGAPAEEEPD